MQEVLALTLQGMQQDAARLERIASNIANVSTTGYKRYVSVNPPASFEATARLLASNAAAPTSAPTLTDPAPGPLKATGTKLDLALTGPGYFVVQTESGQALTRAGDFRLDAMGRLVNRSGEPVLGLDGTIQIGNEAQVHVDGAGRVFDRSVPGQTDKAPVAQLMIVQPGQLRDLTPAGAGLFWAKGELEPVDSGRSQVRQGYLEGSNVRPMEEMIQLMSTMRHFEAMQKMAVGYDEMVGGAIRKLGELS